MNHMLRPEIEPRWVESASPSLAVDLRPMVQHHVIPRLREALGNRISSRRRTVAISSLHALDDEIGDFAQLLLQTDQARVTARIEVFRSNGLGLCEIYLRLLGPAATRLRDMWRDDLCGLADVTLGLCNLHWVLRHYAMEFYGEAYRPETGLRALLAAPPQSESTADMRFFSVLLLSEFFRRDGWDAWIERSFSSGAFRNTVLSGWFDLVEILVTSDKELDEVASGIRFIRRGSPNPQVGVIVCGEVFRANPDFVRLVGADFMATDPLSSLSHAHQLSSRPIQRRRLS